MPKSRRNIVYPTAPEEKKRLAKHIAKHKYTDKALTLPCSICKQTTPHAVAKLIEKDQLQYAVRCSNCHAVAVVASHQPIRRKNKHILEQE